MTVIEMLSFLGAQWGSTKISTYNTLFLGRFHGYFDHLLHIKGSNLKPTVMMEKLLLSKNVL